MILPDRIFFTGCPGSRWSGIAQDLEQIPGVNTSDHSPTREYLHGSFAGHKGAYFGTGMEFTSDLEQIPADQVTTYVDSPWQTKNKTRIIKSHEWAYRLPFIKETFPDDWIMLIYRPAQASYNWWVRAGGFSITYPSYTAYSNFNQMFKEITNQNEAILKFSAAHDASWHHYSNKWVFENFGYNIPPIKQYENILVTIIK